MAPSTKYIAQMNARFSRFPACATTLFRRTPLTFLLVLPVVVGSLQEYYVCAENIVNDIMSHQPLDLEDVIREYGVVQRPSSNDSPRKYARSFAFDSSRGATGKDLELRVRSVVCVATTKMTRFREWDAG